ncbi:MAG: aminotransferase class V-fold PLP-dependent enzyme [Bacteroidota bacterium]|nr:aminotransferase class V-fold PLP-dependent enzyme [Bacteroidota bacterium]MDE2958232.1 aminotransferase class V-fold PLP-dependent enzyme [Bacteroidota bacterium]
MLNQNAAPPMKADQGITEPVDHTTGDGDIYLDYAATTPVDPAVAREMNRYLTGEGLFGNPASVTHQFGKSASDAVAIARRDIAALVYSKPKEIIWTSGATEAINLGIKGGAFARRDRGRHIVTSPLEHRAVLDCAKWLESQGFEISYVEPNIDGEIDGPSLMRAMRSDTILVALMLVNNETGTITDIERLGRVVHEQGAVLHVDAVQGAARILDEGTAASADLLSISGHKMYGPKGIGALRVSEGLIGQLVPQMHGGGHESGLRSGTLPTHQIVGMGAAARLVRERRYDDALHDAALDRILREIVEQVEGISINGSQVRRVPGIMNLRCDGVEAESLMLALRGIAVSAGAACTSAETRPSHVLRALGLSREQAMSSVRFSFGRFTTRREIEGAAFRLAESVRALRRLAA